MSLPIAYRQEVRSEIDAAYTWYEGRQPGLGDDFLTALRDRLAVIQQTPDSYPVIHRRLRAAPVKRFPYVVYYRIDVSRITVVAVQHGRQHPSRWKGRS